MYISNGYALPHVYHEGTFELIGQHNADGIAKYCSNIEFENDVEICVKSVLPATMIFKFEREDFPNDLNFYGWAERKVEWSEGLTYQGMFDIVYLILQDI